MTDPRVPERTPLPPNPLGVAVLTSSAVLVTFDGVVIGMRLWARVLKRKKLSIGDYLILTSWVGDSQGSAVKPGRGTVDVVRYAYLETWLERS